MNVVRVFCANCTAVCYPCFASVCLCVKLDLSCLRYYSFHDIESRFVRVFLHKKVLEKFMNVILFFFPFQVTIKSAHLLAFGYSSIGNLIAPVLCFFCY